KETVRAGRAAQVEMEKRFGSEEKRESAEKAPLNKEDYKKVKGEPAKDTEAIRLKQPETTKPVEPVKTNDEKEEEPQAEDARKAEEKPVNVVPKKTGATAKKKKKDAKKAKKAKAKKKAADKKKAVKKTTKPSEVKKEEAPAKPETKPET